MSKSNLARSLVLAATLAAMTLAGLTAVAQAQPTAGVDQRASQDQSTSDSVKRAAEAQERYYSTWSYGAPAVNQALAQERYYSTWSYGAPAVNQALAQERYYSTWGYGDTPAPVRPAEPSGQPGWLLPAIGVLAGVLALLGVLAAVLVRRARGRVRVHQTA
jgi:hypothetical protein